MTYSSYSESNYSIDMFRHKEFDNRPVFYAIFSVKNAFQLNERPILHVFKVPKTLKQPFFDGFSIFLDPWADHWGMPNQNIWVPKLDIFFWFSILLGVPCENKLLFIRTWNFKANIVSHN